MKLFYILMSILLIAGCTSKPINNISNEIIPTTYSGNQLKLNDIELAIITGAHKRGWVSRAIKPGLIESRISNKGRGAVVEIKYSVENYSISFKSSENLNEDDGSIHKKYNKWVLNLNKSIQSELGKYSIQNK
jgi:hypothetical protein